MKCHSERSEVQQNEVEGIPWNYLEVLQRDPLDFAALRAG